MFGFELCRGPRVHEQRVRVAGPGDGMPMKGMLAVVLVAACGSSGTKIRAHDLPAARRDALCDRDVQCGLMPDKPSCLAALNISDLATVTILADIDGKTIAYDEGLGGQCVDDIRGAGCTFAGVYTSTACRDMFAGTVGDGGACFVDAECQGN